MHTKRDDRFFKRWVQFRVGAILCGCNSTSTISERWGGGLRSLVYNSNINHAGGTRVVGGKISCNIGLY